MLEEVCRKCHPTKAAASKKAAPKNRTSLSKKKALVTKALPIKKAASVKKAAPVKKAAFTKQAVPVKIEHMNTAPSKRKRAEVEMGPAKAQTKRVRHRYTLRSITSQVLCLACS